MQSPARRGEALVVHYHLRFVQVTAQGEPQPGPDKPRVCAPWEELTAANLLLCGQGCCSEPG